MDSLTKNNEQLHLKLNGAMRQVAELEDDLLKMQKHSERLEEKVRNCNSQIQNYKSRQSESFSFVLSVFFICKGNQVRNKKKQVECFGKR